MNQQDEIMTTNADNEVGEVQEPMTREQLEAYRKSTTMASVKKRKPVTQPKPKGVSKRKQALGDDEGVVDEEGVKLTPTDRKTKKMGGEEDKVPSIEFARPEESMLDTAMRRKLTAVRDMAQRVRRLPMEQLRKLDDYKCLSDFPVGSVLECFDIGKKKAMGVDEFYVVQYFTTLSDGARQRGSVAIPKRCADLITGPSVLVYLGKKLSRNSGVYYNDLRVIPVEGSETLGQKADGFRKLSLMKLTEAVKFQSLSQFAPGTVIVYWYPRVEKVETLEGETRVSTVRYEAMVDGEEKKGRMFVPDRLVPEFEKRQFGVVVYKGLKETKNGDRSYHDVSFLDEVDMTNLHL